MLEIDITTFKFGENQSLVSKSYKRQFLVDDKTIYQLLANFKNKPKSWIFLCQKLISQLSNLLKISPQSAKVTSPNCLWITKPYTNSWDTSRISINLEFFYFRTSLYYFQICPTFTLVLPHVQVPIICGEQNHIPTVGRLQE